MGKKKRLRKSTVYGSVEGNREIAFLNFLREIYKPESNNIALQIEGSSGGAPDKIVGMALQKCDREKSFAWFDEDFEQPLSINVREALVRCWCIAKEKKVEFLKCAIGSLQSEFNNCMRNPILIISQPVSSESLIMGVLGHKLLYEKYIPEQKKKQIDGLKNKLNQLMNGKTSIEQQIAYYREHLTREALEEKRSTIVELDLLISMMTND